MNGALLGMWLALTGISASAAESDDAIQRAQIERVRARVAGEIQLSAYDLVDELALVWKTAPIFAEPTAVVLADVSVPVGMGTGMQALLENHLSSVLLANPDTNVRLVHCPSCMATVVHSGPEGTVVSRGIDQPEVLAQLGEDAGKHALFVDVEAQGQFLVLRARLTRLTPELPVVWSRTLSSSTASAAMLRQPGTLKTAEEAVNGADIVYADSWMSYGIKGAERDRRMKALMPFQVTPELMSKASTSASFMNCLPAVRGEEQLASVIDGPQSIVFDQAENRLHAQKALLVKLLVEGL